MRWSFMMDGLYLTDMTPDPFPAVQAIGYKLNVSRFSESRSSICHAHATMARNEQLIRQHRLLQILERYRFGRTLDELRDELVDELGLTSLHTRSVRRDLQALQAAGVDVDVHEIGRGKVWKFGPRFRGTHKISASATELIALSLSRDLMFPLTGTPFWVGIESFWSKVKETLPSGVWQHYEKFRQVLYVLGTPAKGYKEQKGIIETINRAIQQNRVLSVEYQRLGQNQAQVREIEPYGLVVYQSSLYIVAAACEVDDRTESIRHLKLDRFRKAKTLDRYFRPLKDFDLAEHLGQSIGIFAGGKPKNFRIRVTAYAARWVTEDPWHTDQKLERHSDGSITITVRAAHDMEIIPRVLTLGSEAELLSPKSSRDKIAAIIGQIAVKYGDAASRK